MFLGGIAFVALKMVNVVASMASTMSEHEKLTPRRKNFAIRTRVLTFCRIVSDQICNRIHCDTYDVLRLLLLRVCFLLLEYLLLFECRTENISIVSWWSTGSLHCTLERTHRYRSSGHRRLVVGVGHFHGFVLVDIAKANIGHLRLSHFVLRRWVLERVATSLGRLDGRVDGGRLCEASCSG